MLTATPMAAPPTAPGPIRTRPRPRLRRVSYEPRPGTTGADPPSPVRRTIEPRAPAAVTSEHAEAHRFATRVLRCALEVLDGRRPPAHLRSHVTASVMRYWKVAVQQRRMRSPARFTRIRLCIPLPGIAEVAVACDIDGRVRALAARFERVDDAGWRCTAVRLG